jgi:hypothetical protein
MAGQPFTRGQGRGTKGAENEGEHFAVLIMLGV